MEQHGQFLDALLQPGQQCHGTAVVEIGVDSFDGLVVIDPDGPDLGVKICQAQVVVVRVLVSLNDFERSAEDAAEEKLGFAFHACPEHHVPQLDFLLVIQPEIVVVRLGVGDPLLFFHRL